MNTERNESTCETCPRHIWKHEVIMVALSKGVSAEDCKPFMCKLDLWYRSGEPVWMAGETLASAAKESAKEIRADRREGALRRILRDSIMR